MDRRTKIIAAVVILVALLLGTLVGVLLSGDDDGSQALDPSQQGGSGTATPTESATPTETPSATTAATPSVSPTPAQTTPAPAQTTQPPAPAPGQPMSVTGAYLKTSEDPNVTAPDPENGCMVHDPDLNDVKCGVEQLAGGTATWVVGREKNLLPNANEPRLVGRIYARLANNTDELRYVAIGSPGVWSAIDVRVASLTGQTKDTLVVEVVFQGSGVLRGYDLVTWRFGRELALRAHHEEQNKAVVKIMNKGVETYAADLSDGAPNCCPNSYTHDRATWDGAQFRLTKLPNVPQPPPPD